MRQDRDAQWVERLEKVRIGGIDHGLDPRTDRRNPVLLHIHAAGISIR